MPLIPVIKTRISIKIDQYNPLKVRNIRTGSPLDFHCEDGYLKFVIEKLDMFEMYEISLDGGQ